MGTKAKSISPIVKLDEKESAVFVSLLKKAPNKIQREALKRSVGTFTYYKEKWLRILAR